MRKLPKICLKFTYQTTFKCTMQGLKLYISPIQKLYSGMQHVTLRRINLQLKGRFTALFVIQTPGENSKKTEAVHKKIIKL